jgi:hypothetical protein
VTIIQNITDQSPQQLTVVLPDGTAVTLVLTYRPQQAGWFWDLSWNGQTPPYQRNGNRLVTSPNFLRQMKNILTFGMALSTKDGSEPTAQEDFVDGTATLFLLSAVDVVNIEETFFSKQD